MIRTMTLAALSVALVVPSVHAQAQTRAQAPASSSAKEGVSDSLFAVAAADGGLTEVALAELGVQKATDPELKKFSQQMVQEHTKLNGELTALATRKGLTLPRSISAGHQFCAQSLAGLTGEEFDLCYAKAQLVAHMASVAMFEAEAERGQDAELKALAAKGLPHIKQHLKEIKPIAMKYEKEKPGTER